MVAAPMWAMLRPGVEWAFSRLQWKSAVAWGGIAVLLPVGQRGLQGDTAEVETRRKCARKK